MVVISVYFLKLRPLAQGISGTGVSVGNMCFPWVTSALISTFTWRGIKDCSMNLSYLALAILLSTSRVGFHGI